MLPSEFEQQVKNRINQLRHWGLSYFDLFIQYCYFDDSTDINNYNVSLIHLILNELITDKDYVLLGDLMFNNEKIFQPDQIHRLFEMGDKFLAKEPIKSRIFWQLYNWIIETKEKIPSRFISFGSWNEFTTKWPEFSNNTFEIENQTIGINGNNLTVETKRSYFEAVSSTLSTFDGFSIKDFPFQCGDLVMLREMLLSPLNFISFENCAFNFEERMELKTICNLAHFHCVNCFAGGQVIEMLQGVSSSLKYLNISRNILTKEQSKQLGKLIRGFHQLEVLNMSGINLSSKYSPDLFEALFLLPNLNSVDLSNNPLGKLFYDQLQQHPSHLEWESLNLESTCLSQETLKILSNNLFKFMNLKYLNISNNNSTEFCHLILNPAIEVASLEQIVLDQFSRSFRLDLFFDKLGILERKLRLTYGLSARYFTLESIYYARYTTSVKVIYDFFNPIVFSLTANDFLHVERLSISLTLFRPPSFDKFDTFIELLTNLKYIEIDFHILLVGISFEKIFKSNPNITEVRLINLAKNFDFCEITGALVSSSNITAIHFESINTPLLDLGIFIAKVKEASFWKNLSTISFTLTDYIKAYLILEVILMPKLTSIELKSMKNFRYPPYLPFFNSVRSLIVVDFSIAFYDFFSVLPFFPYLTTLQLSLLDVRKWNNLNGIMNNLRSLSVISSESTDSSTILDDASQFPLLTDLTVNVNKHFGDIIGNSQLYFHNLTSLKCNSFKCSECDFQADWLRKFHLSPNLYFDWRTNLEQFVLLEELYLYSVGINTCKEFLSSDLFQALGNLIVLRVEIKSDLDAGGLKFSRVEPIDSVCQVYLTINDKAFSCNEITLNAFTQLASFNNNIIP